MGVGYMNGSKIHELEQDLVYRREEGSQTGLKLTP